MLQAFRSFRFAWRSVAGASPRSFASVDASFPSSSTASAPTREGRKRVGFRLNLTCKPELLEEYKLAHQRVWPEMQVALRDSGWHNYSLFLGPDGVMFGYFEADEGLQDSLDRMGSKAINETWQDAMKKFAPDADAAGLDSATALDMSMVELEHIMYIGVDKPVAEEGTVRGPSSTRGQHHSRAFSTLAAHFSTSTAVVHSSAVTEKALRNLTRRQLQARAKDAGVKANSKSEVIIQNLLKLANPPATGNPTVADDLPEPKPVHVLQSPSKASSAAKKVETTSFDTERFQAVMLPFWELQEERHKQLEEQFYA